MSRNWRSPTIEVFERLDAVLTDGGDGVLATIVDVDGNAYRRPGAKMVIDGDDDVGHLTAGCLEDEVLELARTVLADGRPRIETFDLIEDDDVWGLGMGCHGVIDVLLEPIGSDLRPAVDAYLDGDPLAAVTVLENSIDGVAPFDRVCYRPEAGDPDRDATAAGRRADDRACERPFDDRREGLPVEVESTAEALAEQGESRTITIETAEGTATIFVDGISPPPELVVAGTGPDVGPVVELAARNEFRVTVIGFRGGRVDPGRFPATVDVRSTSPRSIRSCHDFDENTYVVVMTHNYVDDRLTLDALLDTSVPYVAVLGARERFERMCEELREDRGSLERSTLERIYAPAGLDLGGGCPNQIATSVVAELLAIRNDRTPTHLRSREAPIHERIEGLDDG